MSYKLVNKLQRLKRRRNRRRDLRKPNPVAVIPIPNAPTAGLLTLPAGLIGELARPTHAIAFSEALAEAQLPTKT